MRLNNITSHFNIALLTWSEWDIQFNTFMERKCVTK